MDKKELIKRLKEQESFHQIDDYSEGFDDGIVFALELAEQLEEPETLSEKWIFDNQEMYIVNDTSENAVNVWRLKNLIVPEPEKPVVPQFVADWFEENKDDFEQNIYVLSVDLNGTSVSDQNEFERWFMLNKNKPIETLVKMKLYGYEVKEKKYYVKEPTTGQFLIKDNQQSSGVKWVDGFSSNPESYTEQEIKDIDERYWGFRKSVEEE